MNAHSELRLTCLAVPARARPLRHALRAFLAALEIDGESAVDILTAVGEAVVNVIEHAYVKAGLSATGEVELVALVDGSRVLRVDVFDRGTFIYRRSPRAGRGFGLRIVEAIARDVSVDASGVGTRVSMLFDLERDPQRRLGGQPRGTGGNLGK